MSKPFDPTKPVQTRSGCKARIIYTQSQCSYGGRPQPIIAEVKTDTGEFRVLEFFADGRWRNHKDGKDLINIPEEPKWRAWKPEEVPIHAWFRRDTSGICWLVTFWDLKSYNPTIASGSGEHHSLQALLRDHKHSLDHGATWLPCGIKE